MKKKILVLGMVAALVAALVVPTAALATNEGEQQASTTSATSILIKNQDSSVDVTTITFPAGVPATTVSNPSNNIPEEQVFGAAGTAQPVVTLSNGVGSAYVIWYNIETFTEGVVATEYYVILAEQAACANADAVNIAVVFDVDTETATTIAESTNMDLYLKVELSALAGKQGTSTITILGETP